MGLSDVLPMAFLATLLLVFIHKAVRMTLDFLSFSNWREVEMTLEGLEITKVGGNGPLVADNRRVKVWYSYNYGAARFQGKSVAIPDLTPLRISQYSPSTYQPLQQIYDTTKHMHGWVDPDHPDRAVLRAVSPRPYLLIGTTMTACFAGLWHYMGFMILSSAELAEIGGIAVAFYLIFLYLTKR